jgi:hypothetical protein
MMELSLMALAQAGAAFQVQCWIAQDKEKDEVLNVIFNGMAEVFQKHKRSADCVEHDELWRKYNDMKLKRETKVYHYLFTKITVYEPSNVDYSSMKEMMLDVCKSSDRSVLVADD